MPERDVINRDDPGLALVSEGHGSPFDGLTVAQARIVNHAFGGLKVLVGGGRQTLGLYVFGGIRLPGQWGRVMEYPGDLILHNVGEDGRVRPGSARVLSAALVTVFVAVQMEPDYLCSQCGETILPGEKVYDVGGLGRQPNGVAFMRGDEYEWEQRFECKRCWWEQ